MSDNSAIEWCDATWQVTVGCSKVAAGCKNCFAIRDTHRLAGNPNPKISEPRKGLTRRVGDLTDWTGVVRQLPQNLDWPLRKKRPLRIFVDSNSDLFHEDVPLEFIAAVYGVMAACPQHTFQILTKRPARMLEFTTGAGYALALNLHRAKGAHAAGMKYEPVTMPAPPLPNVWHGVSVAEQKDADRNIPILLQVPSAIHFISAEPLIGPVDLTRLINPVGTNGKPLWPCAETLLFGIDWAIAGGESGPGARPCDVAWIRSIVEQCKAAGVACFVKQDSAPKPGQQGRIPNELWLKEYPNVARPA